MSNNKKFSATDPEKMQASNQSLQQEKILVNTTLSSHSVLTQQTVSSVDFECLKQASDGDTEKLQRMVIRRECCEPLEYIVGWVEFRQQRFHIDRRVYVTEPENTHLVDVVVGHLNQLNKSDLVAAEFGVGCGSLSICVASETSGVKVVGVDIDDSALKVAAINIESFQSRVELLESNLFESWHELPEPDVIFGDPPWGDQSDDDCYEETPPLEHFLAMPTMSCFPIGSKTGAHESIIQAVIEKKWKTDVFLNCGSLGIEYIHALGERAPDYEILSPVKGASILHCIFRNR